MKRNELEVGETYAVLAPSQRANIESVGYRFPTAKHVMVLDTEPVWKETYRGWGSKQDLVTVEYHGRKVQAADYTRKVGATDTYGLPEAKRSVKVLVIGTNWNGEESFEVACVPMSNVAMTWAEYEAKRQESETARDRQWKAQRKARAEAEERSKAVAAERDAFNAVLEGTDVRAKVVDGQVVLAGPLSVLKAIVETCNDRSLSV